MTDLPDVGAKAVLLGGDNAIKVMQQLGNAVDNLNKIFETMAKNSETRAKQRTEERAQEAIAKAAKDAAKVVAAAAKAREVADKLAAKVALDAATKAAALHKKLDEDSAKSKASLVKLIVANGKEFEKAEAATAKAAQKAADEIIAAHERQKAAIANTMGKIVGIIGVIAGTIAQVVLTAVAAAVAAIAGFVATVVGIMIGAVTFTAKFQQQMGRVGAVTAASASDMNRLTKQAIEMSRSFTFTAAEIGTVQEKILSAGVSMSNFTDEVIRQTLALATLVKGEMDLGTVADFVGGVMTAWGISAERIADAVAGVATASAVTAADIIRSMRQVSMIAELAGASFEDVIVLVGLMGQELMKGSDAGTALKQMYISLFKAQGPAYDMMQKYHIGLLDGNGKALAMVDVIKQLKYELGAEAVAQGRVTEANRLNAISVIFGSDAMRSAAILANLDATAWDNMGASIGASNKSATDMASRINRELVPRLQIMKNNLEAVVLTVAGPLTTAFANIAGDINRNLQAIDLSKFEVLGKFISDVITKGKGDTVALGEAFGSLAAPIQSVIAAAQGAYTIITKVGTAIAELALQLLNTIMGAGDFSESMDNVTTAATKAADGITNFIYTVVAVFENLPLIGELAQAVFDYIVEVVLDFAGTSEEAVAKFAKAVADVFKFILDVADIFTSNFSDGFSKFWALQGIDWANAWNNLVKIVVDSINSIIKAYNRFIGGLSPFVAGMLFGGNVPKIIGELTAVGTATNAYVGGQVSAFKKLQETYDKTVDAIEKRRAQGAANVAALAASFSGLLKFSTLTLEMNERRAKVGTTRGTGAVPVVQPGGGGGGDDMDALINKIMLLMKGFPMMNREVAEFLAKIAKEAPARLLPMVNALWQAEGIAQKMVVTARNYAATQIQIALSEQKLTSLRASKAAIDARIAAVQAEAQLRIIPLQQQMLQLDMQISNIRNQISIIDERINKLTRENLTLKLETANIEIDLLDRRQRIAQIDFEINVAQRKAVELIAQRVTLENDLLPVRQKIAQLERNAEQIENKKLKLLAEEKQIRLDIQRTTTQGQLDIVESKLTRAWNKMDIKSILALEEQKTVLEEQLVPIEENSKALQNQQALIDLNNQLAVNGIQQQIQDLKDLSLGQENQVFMLQQQEAAYTSANAVIIAGLELEKQLLLDTMAPQLQRLFIIQQTQLAEATRVGAAVVLLQMEKQALEDQLGPLERRRAELDLQIKAIQLETAAITAQMLVESAHLAAAIANEEVHRADLEVTRLKQEAVFTELIQEFVDSLTASGAFSTGEGLETAKRLGFWNEQIEKLADLVSKFADLEQEAEDVQTAIASIERTIDITITTTHIDKYEKQGYQHGGTVPGPYGMPVMVQAHGGERYLGMAHSPLASTERVMGNVDNSRSNTYSPSYNVNANYANQQSPASIRMDLAALTMAARR